MIEHFWSSVPGWFCGAGIYAEQVTRAADGAVFVELGAWKGRSASFMGVEIANSGKNIRFFSVDHWQGSSDEAVHQQDPDVKAKRLFDVYMSNTHPVRDHVHPVTMDSSAAAGLFSDQSVDFLYIDATHTYDGVRSDLQAWWPKIKRGGVIAGDDWCFPDERTSEFGVRRAVQEFFVPKDLSISVLPGEPAKEWEQWLAEKG